MSDEKFEEFIKREAGAYQTPPTVTPRDEMWSVIAKARASRQGGAAGHIAPKSSRPPRLRYASWIGMAATLLLGVGIGRFMLQRNATTDGPSTSLATSTTAAPVADPTAVNTVPTVPDDATPEADMATPRRVVPAARGTPVRLAASTAGTTGANGNNGSAEDPMQVASREHLGRAEALISVISASPADAMLDSLTGRWARDMLTTTRLLLDSPAGDDPVRRRLLEDLETVFVLLVQRSGTTADERALLDRSLERTQLLTRLRTNAAGI
jgi:hypothetical protein